MTPPQGSRPRLSGRNRRRVVGVLLVSLAVVGGAVGIALLSGFLPKSVVAGDPKAHGLVDPKSPVSPITIKAIRPKNDPSVQLTIEQLGIVEAFYQADLRARASGLVRDVHKNIGDKVHQGELLIEIDVPDLVQEVNQRQAVVVQRQQELRVSQANSRDADAIRQVAKAIIREKEALVAQAEATRDLRQLRLARLQKLVATDSVVAGIIDEEERDYRASEAAVTGAKAGVERARADAIEAESKIEAALADTDLKAALVEVARTDLERARIVADMARIPAPFDGVVIRRNVDRGSFVQNATTGQSEALMSVARTDLVTFTARFTDAAAPFVEEGTEALITFNNPSLTIKGKVTRYAPSIQNSDRTMRVEVDLFNGSEEEHDRLMHRIIDVNMSSMIATDPLTRAIGSAASFKSLTGLHKGESELYTLESDATLPHHSGGRLIPGMSGTMKLTLSEFQGGYILPSTAVYSRSGTPYILVVENGVTKQKPVRVQVNDGRVTKVVFVNRARDSAGVLHDGANELTGQEVVVVGRQLEIGEGVPVQASIGAW